MGANKGQKDCPLGGPLKNHSFLLFCIKLTGSSITACCCSTVNWEASHTTQSDCTFEIPQGLLKQMTHKLHLDHFLK